MRTLLSHRRAPLLLAALGVLLCLPALGGGIVGDDFFHRSVLLGTGTVGEGTNPLTDLFELMPRAGTPRAERFAEVGVHPWWAHPDLFVDLYRPLTAATHVLDYALWPESYVLQHAHGLAWYGLLVLLAGLLYRRIHPGAALTAGVATLLFAVEDAHAMPAGWIANRHALVAAALGVAALLLHLRWRRAGGSARYAAAVGLFAIGLFASEAALGVAAYLFAWELTLARAPWPRRLAALTPYGLAILAWRVVYDLGGHGTGGSDLYVDPGRDPLRFAAALLERWPLLQAGQWAQLPVEVTMLLDVGTARGIAAASALGVVALVALLWPLLRDRPEARFWALGSALAAVPLCAAFPMDRLLTFGGLGACALIAMAAERWGPWGAAPGAERSRRRWAVGALLLLHVPVAGLLLVARTATLPMFDAVFASGDDTAPTDGDVSGQTLVFLTGQDFPVAYLGIRRELDPARPAPGRVVMLTSITSDVRIEREDADTLVVAPAAGFLATRMDRLLRSLDVPFRPGERIARPGYEVEIRSVLPDGRPAVAAFHFERPLEDPQWRWLVWEREGVAEAALPPIGGGIDIPSVWYLPARGAAR